MDSVPQTTVPRTTLRDRLPRIRLAGFVTMALSLAAMVGGVGLVGTLASDLEATMNVSRSALSAIGETIDSVDEVATATGDSLEAAGASVEGVSVTIDSALLALENVAVFLETDLPDDLDSVRASMPAAIQAANAVDATLRALSFVGVPYDPDQPFGESLSELDDALASLPDELRLQAESLRLLIPSAEALSADTEGLASEIDSLGSSLSGFTDLTDRYEATLIEAEQTIEVTAASVGQKVWLGRVLAILIGGIGVSIGFATVWIADELSDRLLEID